MTLWHVKATATHAVSDNIFSVWYVQRVLCLALHSFSQVGRWRKLPIKSSNQVMAVLQFILGTVICFLVKQSSIWPSDFQTPALIPCSRTASLACWATWLHACAAWRWWRWGSDKGWIVTKAEACRQSDFSPARRLKNRCLELEHSGQMDPLCSGTDRSTIQTGTMTIPVKKKKVIFLIVFFLNMQYFPVQSCQIKTTNLQTK